MDTSNRILFFGVIAALNAGLALVLSGYYIEKFRFQRKWEYWELSAFIAPQVVWAAFMVHSTAGKSLSNIGESSLLILITPVLVGLRGVIGQTKWPRLISGVFILALIIAAHCCYRYTPALPEGSTEPANIPYNIIEGSLLAVMIASYFIFKRYWRTSPKA